MDKDARGAFVILLMAPGHLFLMCWFLVQEGKITRVLCSRLRERGIKIDEQALSCVKGKMEEFIEFSYRSLDDRDSMMPLSKLRLLGRLRFGIGVASMVAFFAFTLLR